MGTGEDSKGKDMGYKFGQTEPDTKEIGIATKQTGKANLSMLTGIYTMGTG
jgi:hypothetical protein